MVCVYLSVAVYFICFLHNVHNVERMAYPSGYVGLGADDDGQAQQRTRQGLPIGFSAANPTIILFRKSYAPTTRCIFPHGQACRVQFPTGCTDDQDYPRRRSG